MVKLLDTETAHGTVFRTSWFLNQARSALIVFLKDYTIIFKAFEGMNYLSSITAFLKLSWVDPASQEVAYIAQDHD